MCITGIFRALKLQEDQTIHYLHYRHFTMFIEAHSTFSYFTNMQIHCDKRGKNHSHWETWLIVPVPVKLQRSCLMMLYQQTYLLLQLKLPVFFLDNLLFSNWGRKATDWPREINWWRQDHHWVVLLFKKAAEKMQIVVRKRFYLFTWL